MAYNQISDLANAELFFALEATPNTLAPATDHTSAAFSTMSLSPASTEDIVTELGQPGPSCVVHHSKHVTGTIEMLARIGPDTDTFLSAAFRDTTRPAEVSLSVAVSFVNAGTHQDGTTGPQLVAVGVTGAFDALNAASSQTDSRQALWWISDAATVGNDSDSRGPVAVKTGSPWDDGADAKVDLDPRFHSTADGWGGTFTEDAADTITLNAGSYIGTRVSAPAGNPTYSFIARFADLTTPQYFYLTGVTLGGPSLSVNRGTLMWSIPIVAAGFSDLLLADPLSGGSYTDPTNLYRKPIRGGAPLTAVFFATDSAIHALDGDEVTDFNWNVPATVNIVHDSVGQDGPSGYTLPRFSPEFSFNWQMKEGGKGAALSVIANAGTAVTCVLQFTDLDGNKMFLMIPEATPGPTVPPNFGGEGPVRGPINCKAFLRSRNDLLATYTVQAV